MNPLDARESDETYEYPARPYTLPMRPVQTFRVLSESGDVPTAQTADWTPRTTDVVEPITGKHYADTSPVEVAQTWSDKYLTASDARVLRQDGV